MLASDIVTPVRIVLNDVDGTRWADSELITWTNDGQNMIAVVRPDAAAANSVVNLVAGTKQTLPADGMRLLSVVRNVNADNSAGRAVRPVDRDLLDAQSPAWHTEAGAQAVKHYVYDNRDPLTYYVYPPALVTSRLEIVFSKEPTKATTLSSVLSTPNIYFGPLLNYVLHRAYLKESEFAQNAQLAAGYLSTALAMLGVKTGKDAAFSPALNSQGQTRPPEMVALQAGGV